MIDGGKLPVAPYESDWSSMVEADFQMGFVQKPDQGGRGFQTWLRSYAPNLGMAATTAEIHWRHILDREGIEWR